MEVPSEQTCACEGWWEEVGYGRQPMEELVLTFSAGNIRGTGYDIVGPFTMSGTIKPDGTVWLYKSYIGMHGVEYFGSYDGEGVMQGHWRIDTLFDKWSIVIKRDMGDGGTSIREIQP